MDYFIFIILIFLSCIEIQSEIRGINRKLIKLKNDKGVKNMSKIYKDLVGKKCRIAFNGELIGSKYTVLEVDEESIKLSLDKKNKNKVIIKNLSAIEQVEILED